MAKSDGRYIGVRVGVKNAGCAGMSYTMDYAESQTPLDEMVEDKGVRILIDPKAVMFLIGTEMDFKREKLGALDDGIQGGVGVVGRALVAQGGVGLVGNLLAQLMDQS